MSEHTPDQAVGSGRNHYYTGQFDAEEPADTEQRLQLVAERDSLRAVNAELLEALKNLMRGYVNLLETGRDKIIFHGGECDQVDVMEANSPHLKQARAAIASARKQGAQG